MIAALRTFFANETNRNRLDYFILGVILLNAVVMVLQCYDPKNVLLHHIDTAILVIFAIEIVVKIIGLRWNGYWKDSWNWFDFFVTAIALGAFVQSCFPPEPTGGSTLNAIFTLRVFRGFRFFRVLKFIPHINEIMAGCRRAVASTSVIVLAFLIIAFIWSIMTCNLFSETAPEYFGDPLTSFYSIFRLFTVEGWYDIPNTVASEYNEWYYQTFVKLFFSVILFLFGIIGMAYINSIIVDAMASDNNDKVLERVKELEAKIDMLLANQAPDGKSGVENEQDGGADKSEAS